MSTDLQIDVLRQCMEIDSIAYQVYASFARGETNSERRQLWEALGRDEADHIRYWKVLAQLHEQGVAREYFDEPVALRATLQSASRSLHEIMHSMHDGMTGQERLTIACLLELTFLHQPLLQALRFARTTDAAEDPLEAYNRHLQTFLDGVGRLGSSLDLRTSVEALRRLWTNTRLLIDRAITDPLTGLLNRRGLRDTSFPMANLAKRNEGTIAVGMADIDHFKSINDAHGHEMGDRVLVAVAAAIKRSVRASDLVARFGGEEFLVFLSDLDASRAASIGEKIRIEVERSRPEDIDVTVSVGVACATLGRSSDVDAALEALTKAADERLYRAKEAGRNRVVAS
jgi:diguanylate cyclase (GGDEF)-like protein